MKNQILFVIVGLAAGAVLMWPLATKQGFSQGLEQGLAQGEQQNEEMWQQKIRKIWPPVEQILSVTGPIKDIQDQTLAVEVTIYPSNPFEEAKVGLRNVRTVEGTKIVRQEAKSQQEYQREIQAYDAAIARGEQASMPSLVKEIELGFSALQIGQLITIEAQENIKDKQEFEATKITIFQ